MKKLMLLAGVAALAVMCAPLVAQADPISLVDLNKRWGSDVGVIASATAKLQSALNEASGGSARGRDLLKLAVKYGQAGMHKEGRLAAQGALKNLCEGSSGPGCDTVPKYGSYVAP